MTEETTSKHAVQYEFSHWPRIELAIIGSPSAKQYLPFFELFAQHLQREERYCYMVDLRKADQMQGGSRKAWEIFQDEHGKELEVLCIGTAYVTSSRVVQQALRAFLLFNRPPGNNKVFLNIDEARIWCADQVVADQAKG